MKSFRADDLLEYYKVSSVYHCILTWSYVSKGTQIFFLKFFSFYFGIPCINWLPIYDLFSKSKNYYTLDANAFSTNNYLQTSLQSDLKLKKYLHIIENSPVYPVIYDSNR